MKTYKNLYPRVCDFENLYHAYRKARRGKRSRPDVAAFEFNLELELCELQEELLAESYRPGPYRHFTIYERKARRISASRTTSRRFRTCGRFGRPLLDDYARKKRCLIATTAT